MQGARMVSLRSAFFLSLLERSALVALSLGSSVILARLLKPEEIGIYSVSLAVLAVAQVLRDFGVGNFLIQESDLTEAHISTAYGVSLIVGIVLFLLVWLLAPYAADFYSEAAMVETIRISSLNFILLPFCTISLALLRRDMSYDRLVSVNLASAFGGFLVSVGLAHLDCGPNSMAIGAVFGNVITGLGAWLVRPDRELIRPTLTEWRKIVNFGGQSSLANVVTAISMNANDLVVGKVLGFHSVAIFSRAQGVMNIFHRDILSAVRNVAFPAFADFHRQGLAPELTHARFIVLLTAFAWPFYGLVSLYALEVVRFMFGGQWDEAVSLVPIFCLAGALFAVNSLIPQLLIAVGKIHIVTRAEVVLQPLRFFMIAAAAYFYRSVEACAVAYLISSMIALPVFTWALARVFPAHVLDFISGLLPSFLVAVVTLVPVSVHVYFSGFSRGVPIDFSEILLASGISAAVWVFSLLWLNHPLSEEPMFLRVVTRFSLAGNRRF